MKRAMLPQVRLRRHRPGDMGWVVQRHGELYWRELGNVARFMEHLDARRERCWIAARGAERLGAVFLVKKAPGVAQLRLLIVEPAARGLGLGKKLVRACIRFARAARYRKLVLWTQSELAAARGIYEAEGFRLVRREAHQSFGKPLEGEYWELRLRPAQVPPRSRRRAARR